MYNIFYKASKTKEDEAEQVLMLYHLKTRRCEIESI